MTRTEHSDPVRPKIVFYSGHCEIVGGDAKYLFELVNSLEARKYELEVYTDKNPVFAERAAQWFTAGIPINYLDTRPALFEASAWDALYESLAARRERSFAARFLARLLSVNIGGFTLLRILKKISKTVLLTGLRDDWHNIRIFSRIFRGRDVDVFHFNNGGYPGKRAGLLALIVASCHGVGNTLMTIQNLPMRRNPLRVTECLMDLLVRRCCARVITVSEKLRREMHAGRGFSLEHTTSIFHGLDDHVSPSPEGLRRKRTELGISCDSPVLLITSNIAEDRKGHAVLFRALKTVKQTFPSVLLLVVGDGSKRQALEALCRELGIADHVRFLGHRSDIAELNDITDIAVVPSIAFEGIPYTIREAMRSSRPVITTDAGGCDEAVINAVNGLVVPQGESYALAGAILKLLSDPTLRAGMGREGRRLFEEKFLLRTMVERHERLYEDLIGPADIVARAA